MTQPPTKTATVITNSASNSSVSSFTRLSIAAPRSSGKIGGGDAPPGASRHRLIGCDGLPGVRHALVVDTLGVVVGRERLIRLPQAERRITLHALTSEPIVLLEEGHCLRDQSLAICEAAGFNNRRDEVQAAGLETMRQMVMAGIGIALIPEMATLAPFGADQLAVYRRFAPPEPKRELVFAWRRSFPRGDALQELARGLAGALATRPDAVRVPTR
jgi:DNA-binding transcriptional LysR family regulator